MRYTARCPRCERPMTVIGDAYERESLWCVYCVIFRTLPERFVPREPRSVPSYVRDLRHWAALRAMYRQAPIHVSPLVRASLASELGLCAPTTMAELCRSHRTTEDTT